MRSLTFKALIDGVHFDPKKGALKIQLIATSHVSMDELTSLGPADESVRITLEGAQTKIDVFPLVPGAEAAPEEEKDEDRIVTPEFPLSKAEGDKDEGEEEEEEEEEGIGDGLI